MIGIGSLLNQRFLLDRELGRGGMGAVYRATDQILQRTVAIKMLKEAGGEEVGKKIRLEAQILARLLHDNVVRLYDFGESEGVYFLVMEEVDGTSFLKRWKRIPLDERLQISAQVADALNYAHHQGVIHRDVKPANVLLTASDQAKLSDFGLSMLAEAKDDTGTIRGTPHYMSPEQARGKRLDHRTDLYSLGVMVYECVTGNVPFLGQAMAVIAQQANAQPAPPRQKVADLAPSLDALIMSLLAKDPAQRPVSGEVVAQALREEAERARSHPRAERTTAGAGIELPPADETGTIGMAADRPDMTAAAPRAAYTSTYAETTDLSPTSSAVAATPSTPPSGVARLASPLAREMLEAVLAEPMVVSPHERYLCGHYLAYLLGGSRRRGFFLTRPLDPRNADRARLMLAMTWLMHVGPTEETLPHAAELLDKRPDIRAALNPIVVMKYLASRDTPAKRKKFRQARKALQEASTHAQKHMLDTNGVLNPGLMPQTLEDLRVIAPERDEVDGQLVALWNRVSEAWRSNADFRQAVLHYATHRAHRDPVSIDLWPEVVYPLIERARWQREFRPRHEAIWDYVCDRVLHLPDAGVRLDRIIRTAVPQQVVEQLDEELLEFVEDPRLEADEPPPQHEAEDDRLTRHIDARVSLNDLTDANAQRDEGLIRLAPVDPYRFTIGDVRDLWREAMATLGKPGAPGAGQRAVPVGPYRLAAIPSVRGRSAGQVALQGMRNKQIELLIASLRASSSSNSKPIIAIWIYEDASAAIVYLDFKGNEKYILWHAPNAQQFNYDDVGDLNHMLYTLGMEAPDQLDRVLSKRFRPRSPA